MKELIRKIKLTITLLNYNKSSLLGFEILLKLLTGVTVIPALVIGSQVLLNVTGYYYLTLENLGDFLGNPVVIVVGILLTFFLICYVILDTSALLFLIDHSYQKDRVTIYQTVRFAFRNTGRVFRKENAGVFLFELCMIPFLSVGELGIVATTVMIPGFFTTLLEKNRNLLCLGMLGGIAGYFFLMKWLYTLHYFTLEQKNFRDSVKCSKMLSGRKWHRDGLVLAGVEALFYMMSFVIAMLGIILVLVVAKICSQLHLLNYVYTSAVWGLLVVVILLTIALGIPVSYLTITILYYLRKESSGEMVIHGAIEVERMEERLQRKIHLTELGIFFITAALGTFLVYSVSTQKVNPQIEYLRTMEVTAHRGISAFYPENTMAAFKGALELQPCWIELDVQQSKDGQIFVMHDRNFKRTTGVNHYSWELTYEEISRLDAGSYFSPTYEGERIPLLSEVIAFAKENNVRLNIELKPSILDVDLEKHVVDLLKEMDFVSSCVVTSQMYSSLEIVKEYCPEIQTVYVMSLAYGNVNKLTAADAFSMEAASITPRMVSRIHNAGKQIYAWTVNSKRKIRRMIDLNVDNIITDHVALANECIFESKTSSVVKKFVQFLRE